MIPLHSPENLAALGMQVDPRVVTVPLSESVGIVPFGADGRRVTRWGHGVDGPFVELEGSDARFYGLVRPDETVAGWRL